MVHSVADGLRLGANAFCHDGWLGVLEHRGDTGRYHDLRSAKTYRTSVEAGTTALALDIHRFGQLHVQRFELLPVDGLGSFAGTTEWREITFGVFLRPTPPVPLGRFGLPTPEVDTESFVGRYHWFVDGRVLPLTVRIGRAGLRADEVDGSPVDIRRSDPRHRFEIAAEVGGQELEIAAYLFTRPQSGFAGSGTLGGRPIGSYALRYDSSVTGRA